LLHRFPENENKIKQKLKLYKMCQMKVVANESPYNPTTADHIAQHTVCSGVCAGQVEVIVAV
jgi:hypothetical protein